jgi:hypothetical protein
MDSARRRNAIKGNLEEFLQTKFWKMQIFMTFSINPVAKVHVPFETLHILRKLFMGLFRDLPLTLLFERKLSGIFTN